MVDAIGVLRLEGEDPFSHTSGWGSLSGLLFGRVVPPYHSAISDVVQIVFRDVVTSGVEIKSMVGGVIRLTGGIQRVCQSLRAFVLLMGRPLQVVLSKMGINGFEDFEAMQESFRFQIMLLWAPFSCCTEHDEARERPGYISVVVKELLTRKGGSAAAARSCPVCDVFQCLEVTQMGSPMCSDECQWWMGVMDALRCHLYRAREGVLSEVLITSYDAQQRKGVSTEGIYDCLPGVFRFRYFPIWRVSLYGSHYVYPLCLMQRRCVVIILYHLSSTRVQLILGSIGMWPVCQ